MKKTYISPMIKTETIDLNEIILTSTQETNDLFKFDEEM